MRALALAAALLALLIYSLWDGFSDVQFPDMVVQSTSEVSDVLFSTYLLPFEVASILLLAALIGAIVLARRD